MMDEYKKTIGERLKYLRKLKKAPVSDILKYMGDMPRSTYTGYEGGKRVPKGENLVKLAEFFGTSVDYLTGMTDDPYLYHDDSVDIDTVLSNGNITYQGKKLTPEQEKLISDLIKTVLNNK